MVVQRSTFFKLVVFSLLGMAFYYAGLVSGSNSILFKVFSLVILLATVPLPFMAMYGKKMFNGLGNGMKNLMVVVSLALLVHHILITYVIMLFARNQLVN